MTRSKDFLVFTVRPRRVELSKHRDLLKKLIFEEEPDFIVFDTLTKLHNEDERENNAIQNVLTELRDICELDGAPIAHMIVHHARKTSINLSEKGSYLTAAEIRGGSAIRGEADVILGLANNAGGSGGGAKLQLIMEARNVDLKDLDLVKENKVIFRLAPTQTSELLKNDFYMELQAATEPWLKSALIQLLAEKHKRKEDTVSREITKWKEADPLIKDGPIDNDGPIGKDGPIDKDGRKVYIWIENTK